VIHMGNARRILIGKSEGKTPLGRFRCIWEDNIKVNLKQVQCGVN
jgi:hypothetical protein